MAAVSLRFVYFILLLVIGLSGEEELPKDGKVFHLTDLNFDKTIKSNNTVLVMFYAIWCGHSRRMFKDFEKTANKLAGEGSHIKLAKVDIDESPSLADLYGIQEYPTLKFFKNGQASNYTGERDTESMTAFIKSHST